MIIGVPKEIKNHENRVGLTPGNIVEVVQRGHQVYVQKTAGENTGFSDKDFEDAGATMLDTIEEVYQKAEMIVKVKEPIEKEYPLIRENHLVFTFFHFASSEKLTHAMIESKSACVAYETVEKPDQGLNLLTPMSEVAGRMSVQEGAKFLEKPMTGKGILLGGVAGVKPAKVAILGGGVVGTEAAKMAAGMGADVTILDVSLKRLRELGDIMPDNINTFYSNHYNILETIKEVDLLIGAVLIPGAKAPKLVTREMLKEMQEGAVIVDVAVDQGGCIETAKPTTHEEPIYTVEGVVHYCVTNMPGAVPFTSTHALNNATLKYVLELADKGWKKASQENDEIKKGLNIIDGKVVYEPVAKAFSLDYTPVEKVLN